MKRKNVWIANDGTEFENQDECIRYEQDEGFHKATIKFVMDHMSMTEAQAIELNAAMSDFWEMIRENSLEFQEVLDLAKPRKKRGRPPKKKKSLIQEVLEKNMTDQIAQESAVVDTGIIVDAVEPMEVQTEPEKDIVEYVVETPALPELPPKLEGDLTEAQEVEDLPSSPTPTPPPPFRAPQK